MSLPPNVTLGAQTLNASEEEPIEEFSLPLTVRKHLRNLIPIICLVGIIGNCMALLLIRTNFWLKKLTSNVYLCTLSLCGCGFLGTVLATWLEQIHSIPLYNRSMVGCKLLTFIAHFCDFNCVWMISWISCDRMIVLYRPGIRRWVSTAKFARGLVAFTVISSVGLYGWCLIVAGIQYQEMMDGSLHSFCGLANTTIMGYTFDDNFFFGHLIVDTAICTVIPSLFIMVVNCFSIYRYRQCMVIGGKGLLRVRFQEDGEKLPAVDDIIDSVTLKKLLFSHGDTAMSNVSTGTTCSRLRSSDLQLSRSLLVVTSTFVLLNVPNYVFRTVDFLFHPKSAVFSMFVIISFLLYYMHHAVLFYMYIFWSPQMKKQLRPSLVRLLECYCFKTVPEFGHRSTSLQAFYRA